MSELAPLKLKGVGTPNVQSLLSYICELAAAHSVSPTQLLKYVRANNTIEGPRGGRSIENNASTFVAYSATTERVVSLLGRLTGVETLGLGTFLALKPVLTARCSDVLTQARRWCPECYFGSERLGYEPLSWNSPYVSRCQIHMLRLVDSCATCGQKQFAHLRALPSREICQQCGAFLERSSGAKEVPLTAWEAWAEPQALELIKYCASPDRPPLIPDAMDQFAATLRSFGLATQAHLGGFMNLLYHRKPGQTASLGSYFSLAALQSCSPLLIMTCPIAAASPTLAGGNLNIAPPERNSKRNANAVPFLEQLITDELTRDRSAPLPPFSALARVAGLSNSCTSRESTYALIRKYAKARRSRELQQKYSGFQLALQAAIDVIRENEPGAQAVPQRDQVKRVMQKTGVAKFIAVAAVSSVVNQKLTRFARKIVAPTRTQLERLSLNNEASDTEEARMAVGVRPEENALNASLLLSIELSEASDSGVSAEPSKISNWADRHWRCELALLDLIAICEDIVEREILGEEIVTLRQRLARVLGQTEYAHRNSRIYRITDTSFRGRP